MKKCCLKSKIEISVLFFRCLHVFLLVCADKQHSEATDFEEGWETRHHHHSRTPWRQATDCPCQPRKSISNFLFNLSLKTDQCSKPHIRPAKPLPTPLKQNEQNDSSSCHLTQSKHFPHCKTLPGLLFVLLQNLPVTT